MTAYRRSLVKATVAGVLLCGLWFVPSAKAAPEHEAPSSTLAQSEARLAGPGENEDTSHVLGVLGVIGGASLVGAGAVLVSHRSRSIPADR